MEYALLATLFHALLGLVVSAGVVTWCFKQVG
jgi:hypothetical protein